MKKEDKIIEMTAQDLANGKAVGWMQGRMEFGPRALGCRSILADPRSEKMQKNFEFKSKISRILQGLLPQVYYKMNFQNGLIYPQRVLICFL